MSNQTKNWLLIVSIIFLIAGIILGIVEKPTKDVSPFAERIQEHFQTMEREVDVLLEEKDILYSLSNRIPVTTSHEAIDCFMKSYTITVFKEDSLVFWNNVSIGNGIRPLELLAQDESENLLFLPNGIYYYKIDSIPEIGKMITYYPIKYQYKLETIYLKNIFAVDRDEGDKWYSSIPPAKIKIVDKGEGYPILNNKGKEVFSLIANRPVNMPWVSYCLFLLYGVSFIFFTLWLTKVSRKISHTHKSWMGVFLLGGTLLLIRILMSYFNIVDHFHNVPFFTDRYSSNYFADTVGDMLINTLLSVWVAIFFHREFRLSNESTEKYPKFIFAIGLYITIVGGILGITSVLRGLVLGTDIPFNFDNIGDLEWSSLVSIIGILFLMLVLFLFTYRISLVIRQFKLTLPKRLFAIGIAISISFSITFLLGMDSITLTLLLLFSIIYTISFDLYIEKESTNLLWIVTWLIIYSAFPSSFIYKYNQIKEWGKRIEYAKFLTDDRDLPMEESLQKLDKEIKADGEITQRLEGDIVYKEIKDLLLRNHSIDLKFIRYQYDLHLFIEDTFANLIPLEPSDISIVSSFNKTDITLENNLRFVKNEDELGTYFLRIKYPRNKMKGDIVMFLELRREVSENTKISTELFISKESLEIEGLSAYDYAIYSDNKLVLQKGGNYGEEINDLTVLPAVGKFFFKNKDGRSHLIYHALNGNVAMMDIEPPHFLENVLTYIAYLISIMVILLGILMLINAIIQFLSFGRESVFAAIPSLKNKIQVSVIALIILSFIIIGVTTIFFFEQKNDEYHEGRLGRKAKSIRGNAAREIEQGNINADSIGKIKNIVDPISKIHSMDINIYDLEGRLIESSGKDIYSKGLKSPIMNAAAFYELGIIGEDRVTMDKDNSERIGQLAYDAQYETLKDAAGNPIAYIGMSYYSQKSKIQDDTSDFISRLLGVYVGLLAVAGIIAVYVANTITKPISQMGEKLKEVKIGKKNEPLEWNSKDEVGTLIDEYNKMIKKLDDSTVLLAQSERESAWREMAKQVAHEIKNPLTPMKLSIQYLQHAYHSNPANMETMLKRVSNTLIEQIDNLAQIATEFSNFAKMPRAENELFGINQLVQSVYDLFSEQRDMDMAIHLPSKELKVFADKNQLMRVFNNLIKNAMQAVPEERKGNVDVFLREIEGDIVQLEVKDNGIGIPDDMEEFIFVPHITTKSSGTGLGLAISKSIIEALDGSIYFESEEEVGTSFFVELPIAHEENKYGTE